MYLTKPNISYKFSIHLVPVLALTFVAMSCVSNDSSDKFREAMSALLIDLKSNEIELEDIYRKHFRYSSQAKVKEVALASLSELRSHLSAQPLTPSKLVIEDFRNGDRGISFSEGNEAMPEKIKILLLDDLPILFTLNTDESIQIVVPINKGAKGAIIF